MNEFVNEHLIDEWNGFLITISYPQVQQRVLDEDDWRPEFR